ncbi:hypothetical protein FOA52_006546 [Chlamydomonas sp. UWO 241]|nr:hypothetical protein FOA52_006546 [Chlamydomonas sp. UWO 241]
MLRLQDEMRQLQQLQQQLQERYDEEQLQQLQQQAQQQVEQQRLQQKHEVGRHLLQMLLSNSTQLAARAPSHALLSHPVLGAALRATRVPMESAAATIALPTVALNVAPPAATTAGDSAAAAAAAVLPLWGVEDVQSTRQRLMVQQQQQPAASTSAVAPAVGAVAAAPQRQHKPHRDNEFYCVVCMDAERCVTLVPCGHRVLCRGCANSVRAANDECPMCRSPIKDAVSG